MHQAAKQLLMSKKYFLPILLLLFFYNLVKAQPIKDEPIELKYCSIDVVANMFIATTTMQLEFYNPNAKVLDGEYSFALQASQVITGFTLDINGHLRQGVIVDKQQGRVAYENIIRRRVDPGLLEMTAGNNYRVRIYPMPAKGTRIINIIISEILTCKSNALQYNLPLDISYRVKELKATLLVNQSVTTPVTGNGFLKGKIFEQENDGYQLSFIEKNTAVKQPLTFQIPLLQNNKIFCSGLQKNNNIFALHTKPAVDVVAQPPLKTATIFWDVSSSAAKRNTKKEIVFIELFLQEKKISNVSIVTFSNTVHVIRSFKANESVNIRRFLESQQFDGGTQLGSLDCNLYNADVFLLCSDGLSNFGNDKIKMNDNAVYCINSSPSANHNLLNKVASTTGGSYFDLYKNTVEEAEKELKLAKLQLLSVKQAGRAMQTNVSLPFQFSGWLTITGNLLNFSDDIVLSFGKDGIVLKEEKIMLQSSLNCDAAVLNTAFMLQQYELLQSNEAAKEKMVAFAKMNRFVTAATSLIVLDTIDDYIQYGIEPPQDLQQEYLKKVYTVKQRAAALKDAIANEEINNVRRAVVLYNDRITWWGNKEALIRLKDKEVSNDIVTAAENQHENKSVVNTPNNSANIGGNLKTGSLALQEVVVIGYGVQRRRDLTGSVTTINASQLTANGAQTVPQALQGRVAGVQVIQAGTPGAADQVFIRGAATMSGNRQPLYIVDGMQVDADLANTLNVNNIESISVIKDAQASAIYGSRAANGVIIITSKRAGSNNVQNNPGIPRYKDLDDEDYIQVLKDGDKKHFYDKYLLMKDSFATAPAFYFDVAQLLFESGDKENALRVLSNLAEMDNENHQLLRAMGYMLESWEMYGQAIDVYKKVLNIKEEEPQSYRDLANAYGRNKEHQQAVDLLYKVITKNLYQYEDRYRGLKSLLLNELNSIINQHKNILDLSKINKVVIKPLPVDLRVVIDWNKDETDIDLHIIEPGGEECFYSHKQTKSGGRLSEDFTQGYGPEEYQVKHAANGKYRIRVNYFGDRYQKKQVPSFIKLTIYKNFGRPNQTETIESIIMDNQKGQIEIGEVKF